VRVTPARRSRTEVSVKLSLGNAWVETRPIRDNITQSRRSMGKWLGPIDGVFRLSRRNQRLAFGAGAAASAYVFCLGLWHQLTHGSAADQAPGMMVVGGVFAVGMLFFLARMSTYTFNRNSATFSRSSLLGPRRRPLTDILAVQLITQYHVAPKFETSKRYSAYQINLVLDDAESPRENLSTTGDLGFVQSGGHALATFLGVPLLDQIETTAKDFL
jgi:hypothetical protein